MPIVIRAVAIGGPQDEQLLDGWIGFEANNGSIR
jgi:hypothetical protein